MGSTTDVWQVSFRLLLFGIVEILLTLFYNFLQFHLGKFKLKYDDQMALQLAEKMTVLDMSYYDIPEDFNQTREASTYSSSILENYNYLLDFSFNIISLLVAFIISIQFNIIVTIISLLFVFPAFFVKQRTRLDKFNKEKQLINNQRFSNYLLGLFYDKNVEMEMQLYNFSDYIKEKLIANQEYVRTQRLNISLKNAKKESGLFIFDKIIRLSQQIYIVFLIIKKGLTLGDYSYFNGIISNLSGSLDSIVNMVSGMKVAIIKYDEYKKIINRQPRIAQLGNLKTDDINEIEIVFDNVSFKYPNSKDYSIHHFSFVFESNKKYALIGENGAGKTTLIKLLLRFYDPTDGKILLNGKDIREYELASYRNLFSAMFQDHLIYLLTIEENIAISDVTNKDRTPRMSKITNDLGLSEVNGETLDYSRNYGREFDKNGYVFSKGQQQRLAAAKTLFKKASFYILDEPAASMDSISEAHFLDTLTNNTKDNAVIYITHRYNNIKTLDTIIVMDHGKIAETGNHDELIRNNKLYTQLYNLQFGKGD